MPQFIQRTTATDQGQTDIIGAGIEQSDLSVGFTKSGYVQSCIRWQPQIDLTGYTIVINSAYLRMTLSSYMAWFTAYVWTHNGSCPNLSENEAENFFSSIGSEIGWEWYDNPEMDTEQTSPDIKAQVQAWFDRVDYNVNDHLGILVCDVYGESSDARVFYMTDCGTEGYRPQLEINYSLIRKSGPFPTHFNS